MLFNKIIVTLACFTGIAQAGQLRAGTQDASADRELTSSSPPPADRGYLFFLESKAYDDHYLGYKYENNKKRAWLKDDKVKFAYDSYWRLEKWGDGGGSGECYEMDDDYKVYLKDCDPYKTEQKWLVSKVPDYYGHYYTISNAHYGYVLEYDEGDYDYYLDTRSWRDVSYLDEYSVQKILFYKEAAYDKYTDQACRTASGGQGHGDGADFVKLEKSRDECRKICSADHKCKGWEYSRDDGVPRCEIWYTEPKDYEHKNGFDCYVKKH